MPLLVALGRGRVVRPSDKRKEIPGTFYAGARVEAVRSHRGVMRYASKAYMGNAFETPPGWEHVGRFWEIIERKRLPLGGGAVISHIFK
jgi:hypothetical protein